MLQYLSQGGTTMWTKEEIGQVIRESRLSAGLTQKQVSEALGRPQQTIASWETGKSQPDANTLFVLFQVLGRSVDDAFGFSSANRKAPLYSSEAEKLAQDYDKLDGHGKKAVRAVADVEIARCAELSQAVPAQELAEVIYNVPRYSLPMSAGVGEPAGQEPPEDYSLKKAPPRGTSYIARVYGHSMEPTYSDGQLVFVHATEEIPAGKIGVFFMDGQQWVKELGDGELISHNPAYPPRPMTEDVRCQGLVLGVCDNSYFE